MSNNQIKNQINHINELKFKDIFLNDCKYTDITDITDKNFKVLYKKIDNLYLVLFGVDVVNIKKNNYLPYIYYLDKNNVKFKQIKKKIFGFDSGFNLENKTFEEIIFDVYNFCDNVKGVGMLAIYDITSAICRYYKRNIDKVYIVGNGPKRAVNILNIKTKKF